MNYKFCFQQVGKCTADIAFIFDKNNTVTFYLCVHGSLCPPHIDINAISQVAYWSIIQMCDPINKVFLFPVPAVEGGGESFCVKGDKGLMRTSTKESSAHGSSLGGSQRRRKASGWSLAVTRIPYRHDTVAFLSTCFPVCNALLDKMSICQCIQNALYRLLTCPWQKGFSSVGQASP